MKFYKATNQAEVQRGMRYTDGLNVDILPFNPSGTCQEGGIYYTDAANILSFCGGMAWVREVTVPDGAHTYRDPSGDKWKADRLELGARRPIDDDFVAEMLLIHQGGIISLVGCTGLTGERRREIQRIAGGVR